MNYIVNTPCGPVQGCSSGVDGIAAYKGIRYATAGRWEYPVQVTSWEGTYVADSYGHCCYQPRSFYDEEKNLKKIFYYNEFRKGEKYTYSEDCLFLNIFTPEKAEANDRLPVIFYIHGGGFTGGCGHEKHFDVPIWPLKGVIGVTINYRLGPLGFACFEEAAAQSGHTGNYGLYDQMTALKWVCDNIASFGGDPQKITIMGQSAGAMSVQQHCLSPLTDGLFTAAVMSSGGGVSRMLAPDKPEKWYPFWKNVMTKAGCETFAKLKEVEPEILFNAWQEAKNEKGVMMMSGCAPCLDNLFVVGSGVDLLKAGKQKQIPYMAGSTSEDLMPPIMLSLARKWCRSQKTNSYAWLFDRRLPGDDNGAWHSSDLWYWFGTIDKCWRPMNEKDKSLADTMTDYLTNFAKTGDPNSSGLPAWYPATKKPRLVMHLGEKQAKMRRVRNGKLIRTMLTNKPVGE